MPDNNHVLRVSKSRFLLTNIRQMIAIRNYRIEIYLLNVVHLFKLINYQKCRRNIWFTCERVPCILNVKFDGIYLTFCNHSMTKIVRNTIFYAKPYNDQRPFQSPHRLYYLPLVLVECPFINPCWFMDPHNFWKRGTQTVLLLHTERFIDAGKHKDNDCLMWRIKIYSF